MFAHNWRDYYNRTKLPKPMIIHSSTSEETPHWLKFQDFLKQATAQVAAAKDAWMRECLRTDPDVSNWQWVVQYGMESREWMHHKPTGKRIEFIVTVRVS